MTIAVLVLGMIMGRINTVKHQTYAQLLLLQDQYQKELKIEVDKLKKQIEEESRFYALGKLGAQVAHDIRSPLAALKTILDDLNSTPETTRVFMRSAINRVEDIANNLLTDLRKKDDTSGKF